MVQTKRLAALLLTLLALLPVPAAWADSDVVSGTTVSGTVRVYLSSIASHTSADVTVDGSYSIGGDASRAIPRGARLTVQNSGGTLLLTLNGQTQTMGSRFKLRRHQTSGNNGVYIAQARKPQSLYPGDIEFIAKGGNVQIVVHVYMEDYMRGVLPYEMDNSFPLEALKAQAVAARTYALKKMSAQAATYDVVDTTSDQVYNGTPSGNERCAQAVQETSGIVGTVNGEYMASYYTASNGGQTESVANAWGSGSYSYLTIKDDPYDLNNSASIAKSVTLYHDGTTSVSALTELLRTEAAARRLVAVLAGGPAHGNHQQDHHQHAREPAGHEQAADGYLAGGAVDDQAHGRRNRRDDQAGQAVDRGGPAAGIPVLEHLWAEDAALHGSVRDGGAGNAAHQGGQHAGDLADGAVHVAAQHIR